MPPSERDAARLLDMLTYAETMRDITLGLTFDDYCKDRVIQLASERALEIVGEAARGVSLTFREQTPEIPWTLIVAHRNVLAHEYGEIRQERVWETIITHIPKLITMLKPHVTE